MRQPGLSIRHASHRVPSMVELSQGPHARAVDSAAQEAAAVRPLPLSASTRHASCVTERSDSALPGSSEYMDA